MTWNSVFESFRSCRIFQLILKDVLNLLLMKCRIYGKDLNEEWTCKNDLEKLTKDVCQLLKVWFFKSESQFAEKQKIKPQLMAGYTIFFSTLFSASIFMDGKKSGECYFSSSK